ncbi:hypothetical protein LSAT2_017392 [Lamellibrachia satsuma]|nr:hypothetical protein LSAT2_017392 [Lamellibrachia satsuma]
MLQEVHAMVRGMQQLPAANALPAPPPVAAPAAMAASAKEGPLANLCLRPQDSHTSGRATSSTKPCSKTTVSPVARGHVFRGPETPSPHQADSSGKTRSTGTGIPSSGTMGRGQPAGNSLQYLPSGLGESLSRLLEASLAPSTRAHYQRAWGNTVLDTVRNLCRFPVVVTSTVSDTTQVSDRTERNSIANSANGQVSNRERGSGHG